MKKLLPLWITLGVLALIALVIGSSYNGLVRSSNEVDAQWKQVGVQYQRRLDLIPNLVATAKGAQIQEQKVFSDIAAARANYAGARTQENQVQAANQLEGSLARLLVITENYPDLKSNENLLRVQDELAGTENRVAVERRRYNDVVKSFNTSTQLFPRSIVASLFNFHAKPYFEAAAGADQAPKVDFGK